MRVLHVNQLAGRGGAAGISQAPHNALLARGQESVVLVGRQAKQLPGVRVIENDRYRSVWGRFWMSAACQLSPYFGRRRRLQDVWLPRLASPARFWSWWA